MLLHVPVEGSLLPAGESADLAPAKGQRGGHNKGTSAHARRNASSEVVAQENSRGSLMSLQLQLWFYLLRAYVPQICTETPPRGAADTSVHSKESRDTRNRLQPRLQSCSETGVSGVPQSRRARHRQSYSLQGLLARVDHPVHRQVVGALEGPGAVLADVIPLIWKTTAVAALLSHRPAPFPNAQVVQ